MPAQVALMNANQPVEYTHNVRQLVHAVMHRAAQCAHLSTSFCDTVTDTRQMRIRRRMQ